MRTCNVGQDSGLSGAFFQTGAAVALNASIIFVITLTLEKE